jgi:uncharacterized phage protein (TIGR02220 family)
VGSAFKPTPSTLRPIRARIAEGHTVAEAELIIRDRMRRWKGTAQDEYLRPATLFGEKFQGYLEAAQRGTASTNGHGDRRRITEAWAGQVAGEVRL